MDTKYKFTQRIEDVRASVVSVLFSLKREFLRALIEGLLIFSAIFAFIIGFLLLLSRHFPFEYILLGYGLQWVLLFFSLFACEDSCMHLYKICRLTNLMEETNWYIICGASCTGKTTLINSLSKLGYFTLEEVPRVIIEEEKRLGKSDEEIFTPQLQSRILEGKRLLEMVTPKNKEVFFDAGVLCNVPYAKRANLEYTHIQELGRQNQYKTVFYCESLGILERDGVRIESLEEATTIGKEVLLEYQNAGYNVVILPAVSVEERVEIILKNIA